MKTGWFGANALAGISSRLCPREQLLRAHEVWPVIHLAVDCDHATARRLGKRIDDRLSPRERCRGWREHGVDRRHLWGMDREPADKAVASRHLGVALEGLEIAEIDVDCFDRRTPGSGRREQADGAREPIGLGQLALRIAVGF